MVRGRLRSAGSGKALARPVPSTLWRWFLLAGLVAGLAAVAPISSVSRSYWYQAVAFGSASALVVGVHLHDVRQRRPWDLLAAGIASLAVGDLISNANQTLFDGPTFPSAADLFYLAGYPLLLAGVLGITSIRRAGREHESLLDAAAVALAAGIPYWVYVIAPAITNQSTTSTAKVISTAYPLLDLVLIALVVRLLLTGGGRSPSFFLLLGGLMAALVGDTVTSLPQVQREYHSGDPLDLVFLAAYVLLGASALHPSVARLEQPVHGPARVTGRRAVLLAIAGAMAPLMLAIEWQRDRPMQVAGILVGWLLLMGLLLTRMVGLMRAVALEANLDPLTRLPNRSVLLGRLDDLLSKGDGAADDVAVLYLDLDRFKQVNDSLGHASGDSLLVELAERLRREVRPGDMVGRLGGDEFVVVCRQVRDEQTARAVADRLVESLSAPFWIDGQPCFVSASIGISRPAVSSGKAAALLREADVAMYRAKVGGSSRSEVFDPSMRMELSLRGRFERDLFEAIDADQLVLHYQPLVSLPSGEVTGVEAVLRWHHPDWGTTKPDSLLPIAEETGLIVPIGRWVVEEACRQLSSWDRRLGEASPPEITVNMTVRELLDPGVVDHLDASMRVHAIAPSRVVLDVSDRYLASAPSAVFDVLARIRGIGVHVCIDEFGIGEASLAHVRRVPSDRLKVDRSFVRNVHDDTGDRLVVASLLRLGGSLGMEMIAAGVETHSQRLQLERMGCTWAQGNLWAPPLPPGPVLESVLARSSARLPFE